MPEPPTPTPAPAIGNPTAPVPKAALLPATVTALLTVVGVLCFVALITPALGCVASFAWETTALLGLTSVWGWFLCRLCLRTARWVLGGGTR
jgi:hypothetical protein